MGTRPQFDDFPLEVLARLAGALDTTVEELLLHAPAAWTGPAAAPAPLEDLDEAECHRLLTLAEVARIGYTSPDGPVMLPVNYVMAAGHAVFRTTESSPLAHLDGQRVALEIDDVDPARREGWSVLLRGVARTVRAGESPPGALPRVDPWPGGRRDVYVIVEPRRITGRRLLHPRTV